MDNDLAHYESPLLGAREAASVLGLSVCSVTRKRVRL